MKDNTDIMFVTTGLSTSDDFRKDYNFGGIMYAHHGYGIDAPEYISSGGHINFYSESLNESRRMNQSRPRISLY